MRTEINTKEQCLSMEEMTAYLSENLDSTMTQNIDAHLQDCELCCGALEALELQTSGVGYQLEDAQKMETEFKRELAKNKTSEINKQASRKITPMRHWLKYAAVFFLAILPPSYFIYSAYFSISSQQLYTAYFQPYEDLISNRSDQQTTSPELINAMSLYNAKDYQGAVELLDKMLITEQENQLLLLYAGICRLELKQVAEARSSFEQLLQNNSIFSDHAKWYLALSYLFSNDIDAAKQLFDKLSVKGNFYQKEAIEILEKLE